MKVICAPKDHDFSADSSDSLDILLYGHTDDITQGSVGASARNIIQHRKLAPAARAWDLLTIALSVVAADTGVRRDDSPDGWTRQLELAAR